MSPGPASKHTSVVAAESSTKVQASSVTRIVEDAKRLHLAAFLPDLLGLTAFLVSLFFLFAANPVGLLLCVSIGFAGLIVGHWIRGGSRLVALALALGFTVCLFLVLQAAPGAGAVGLLAIPVAAVPAVLAWRAVPSAFRLRHWLGGAPPIGPQRELRIPRDQRMFEAIGPAMACLFILMFGLVGAIFGGFLAKGAGAGLASGWFARRFDRSYRKLLGILSYRAQEVRAQDRRPPILYFRSFMDEELMLERPLSMVQRLRQGSRTLEEVVVDRLWSDGPVIAVGRPVAEISPLGAAREYIEGPDWQARVSTLLAECSFAVTVLGETEGLLWEYRSLAAKRMPLLVVLPHGTPEVLTHRWNAFCGVYPAALNIEVQSDGKGEFPLLVLFREGQSALVLTSKDQNELSYELGFDDARLRQALAQLASAPTLSPGGR
jgi:hypothetical protein